ncbi:MAG: hypothetical protein RJA36_2589 [Pseudomonadota bacterium]|jgi:hypothetical protein
MTVFDLKYFRCLTVWENLEILEVGYPAPAA